MSPTPLANPDKRSMVSCFTHPTHFAALSQHLVPFQQVVSHQLADFVLSLPASLDHLHFCFCWRLPLKVFFICRSVTAARYNLIVRFRSLLYSPLTAFQRFGVIKAPKPCCSLCTHVIYLCFSLPFRRDHCKAPLPLLRCF